MDSERLVPDPSAPEPAGPLVVRIYEGLRGRLEKYIAERKQPLSRATVIKLALADWLEQKGY